MESNNWFYITDTEWNGVKDPHGFWVPKPETFQDEKSDHDCSIDDTFKLERQMCTQGYYQTGTFIQFRLSEAQEFSNHFKWDAKGERVYQLNENGDLVRRQESGWFGNSDIDTSFKVKGGQVGRIVDWYKPDQDDKLDDIEYLVKLRKEDAIKGNSGGEHPPITAEEIQTIQEEQMLSTERLPHVWVKHSHIEYKSFQQQYPDTAGLPFCSAFSSRNNLLF